MRTEKTVINVPQNIIKYFADDGTEFKTEEECLNYEKSIKFNLWKNVAHLLKEIKDKQNLDFILDGDRAELNYYTVIFSSDEEIKAFCEYVKDLNTFCNSKKQFYISFEELEKNKKYIFAEDKYFSFITSKEKVLDIIKNTFLEIKEE